MLLIGVGTMGKLFSPENDINDEIPFTEDLMREHGALNRVLLIYEEIIRRLEKPTLPDFQVNALKKAVEVIQDFIENYHEKLEEDYIFPLFEKNKREVTLVKTLRKQHQAGRDITAKLLEIINSKKTPVASTYKTVITLLKKFVRMYRPHEAREDTVLFPQVRSMLSEKEFKDLGEKFEDIEHELFGKEGFFGIVKKIEGIEKELGIYKLEQFTPVLSPEQKK
jgi:hemerythrin-like domain-containing protein